MSREEVADPVIYRAELTREPDGSAWTATSPDVDGAITWGRSLRGALDNLREAIALVLSLPDDVENNIEFELSYDLGDEHLNSAFDKAVSARESLAIAQQTANQAVTSAIARGRERDMSVRDLATLVGISFQRVQQISADLSEYSEDTAHSPRLPEHTRETFLDELARRLHFKVVGELAPTLDKRDSESDAELRLRVLDMFKHAIDEEPIRVSGIDRRTLISHLAGDVLDHACELTEHSADALSELRGRLYFRVVEELEPHLSERPSSMSDSELRIEVLERLDRAVGQQDADLSAADKRVLVNQLASDILDHAGLEHHERRHRRIVPS